MAQSDIYSTIAADGSADEFGPSPTHHAPKTPSQVSDEKALSRARIQNFLADPTTSAVSSSLNNSNTIASRLDAAQASISAVHAAFSDNAGAMK